MLVLQVFNKTIFNRTSGKITGNVDVCELKNLLGVVTDHAAEGGETPRTRLKIRNGEVKKETRKIQQHCSESPSCSCHSFVELVMIISFVLM